MYYYLCTVHTCHYIRIAAVSLQGGRLCRHHKMTACLARHSPPGRGATSTAGGLHILQLVSIPPHTAVVAPSALEPAL